METAAPDYERPAYPECFFRMDISWNVIEFTSRYPPFVDGSA